MGALDASLPWLLPGLLAGLLATLVLRDGGPSALVDGLVGSLGAFLGHQLAVSLGIRGAATLHGTVLAAVFGAATLLLLLRAVMLARPRSGTGGRP